MTRAIEYAQQKRNTFRDELMEWLKLPSISTDPAFAGDVEQAAKWLAANMMRMGLQNVQVMPTGGHPVVYGEWLGAGSDAPTVLVYGHYDVQPAVVEDGWETAPFEPVEKDGKLYARGATDDKGQVMIQMKAAESLLASGECPVNLKYLIEGEEEIGSPNLATFISDHKDMLQADICLISDTGMVDKDQPGISYSLRGLLTMQVTMTGPHIDLHSGLGGMLHNPAQAIAEICAALHNPDGTVAVPGFYDDVQPLSDEEREALRAIDISDTRWQAMIGDKPDWGEKDYTRIERSSRRPTLEINGIHGGYTGEGFKTVIPARAFAKISCRLVPDQDPLKILEQIKAYIREITPDTVAVEVTYYDHGYPAITPIDHPAIQAAVRALAQVWPDVEPLYLPVGGSIPVVTDFQKLLNVPVVLLGFGLPDAQAHGPNESFHLDMYGRGIQTIIHYMHEVAK